MAKLINEIGNTYGYLTVIERAENKGSRAMWKCRCKCGNEIITSGKLLRNGHTQSCGCYKIEKTIERNMERGGGDLTGQRFGKLTVVEFDSWLNHENGHKDRMWKCLCDCGNTCIVNHRYLRNGDTSSCGCANSKGNATIVRWLNSRNIKYIDEYTFKDFVSLKNNHYRFDFAILNKDNSVKFLIEYQGSIHFIADGTGWNTEEALIERQKNDKIKAEYCKENNITLHYITYKEDIEERLGELLNG